ncbi:MAG: bifunctional pyr operon transcriptional regulator/uracil phosphoribosyltransferase PyrR [Bacteroidia bacterium]|nr:bifunctional pyr operon transcriptional regulator/uracil phosphoribosyltransferase PyrR [Bacteroidia bacterium]MCX7764572.1 bifunctional pyr operon transcriptional regulator/uracil phosphoribosyltransferase PyrR [Bacteroidia bacterium]MDW8056807.1 bifunctional pyr operon transcriptional regulator/uracil phosphoribosyltransferase PyrR [Bacteroidia bacterium]
MQRIVAAGERVNLTLRRLALQIIEKAPPYALIGIHPRGVPVAEALHSHIQTLVDASVLLGSLDVTFWRDDLHYSEKLRIPRPAHLPFPIEGKLIWLVDDVLYTGRTVRAALDALREIGRPAAMRLAVLVERRGLREVPLAPDCAGFVLDTHPSERVTVQLQPEPLIQIELAHA